MIRQGCTVLIDDITTGMHNLPVELDTGGFQYPPGGFGNLRADTVSRD
jgi:hypothetical protein